MIVYAKQDGTIIWSDFRENHKQGRVSAGTPLKVISPRTGDWHEIEEPPLDREVKEGYPNFWVKKVAVFLTAAEPESPIDPVPAPEPIGFISDKLAGEAVVILWKWWKQ